jgi:hypothetical protein
MFSDHAGIWGRCCFRIMLGYGDGDVFVFNKGGNKNKFLMKRLRFWANTGYQLKTAASVAFILGTAVTVILIVIGYRAWSYSTKLERVVQNQTSFMENQREIFVSLLYLRNHRVLNRLIYPVILLKRICTKITKSWKRQFLLYCILIWSTGAFLLC